MSQLSLFRTLDEAKQLVKVAVDDAQVLVPASGKRAIGTHGLNGCTCIVVMGHAILLAHISPLPGTFQQWQSAQEDVDKAGRTHLANGLEQVGKLIRQQGDRFPTTSTVFGIFSLGKRGPMTFVISQSQTFFNSMGFDMRRSFYREIESETWSPPKGEVVAFYNRNGDTELYQEATKLWPQQAPKSSSATSQAASASSQSVPPSTSTSTTQTTSSASASRVDAQSGQSSQRATIKVGRYTFTEDSQYLWSPAIRQWVPTMRDDKGVQRVQIRNKAYRMLKQGDDIVYVDENDKTRVL